MPGPIIERVTTEPVVPVVPVRDLEADEEYVMNAFERHARHCTQCVDPLQVYEENRTLCDRGHLHATTVADYLYSKHGKAYSVVDREAGHPSLVKIPRQCESTINLLLAIEDGLRINRKQPVQAVQAPVVSYDSNYLVVPRRTTTPPAAYNEIIEREPRTMTKRRRVIVYHSPSRRSSSRGSPSRGSLYESDSAARVERVKETSRKIRPAEYYR